MALMPVTTPLVSLRLSLNVRVNDLPDVQEALEACLGQVSRRVFDPSLVIDRNRGGLVATIRFPSAGDTEIGSPTRTTPVLLSTPNGAHASNGVPPPTSGMASPATTAMVSSPIESVVTSVTTSAAMSSATMAMVSSPITSAAASVTTSTAMPALFSRLPTGHFLRHTAFTAQEGYPYSNQQPLYQPFPLPVLTPPTRGRGRGRPRRSASTMVASSIAASRGPASTMEDEADLPCMICHEEDPNRQLSCGHTFHKRCLRAVTDKSRCPACNVTVDAF